MAMTDYVRSAIREKAAKDLSALEQRKVAFEAVDSIRAALKTVLDQWGASSAAFIAVGEVGAAQKVKKLRKALDEADMLARDMEEAIGGAARRSELMAERQSILTALKDAGLEEDAVIVPAAPSA